MASSAISILSSSLKLSSSSSSSHLSSSINSFPSFFLHICNTNKSTKSKQLISSYYFRMNQRNARLTCRAAEYKFPDPIPEFADAETEKFKTHLINKLSKKDIFGDSIEDVVGVCTEIFNTFLHTEYGGPGTLMVVPFIDMADTLNERGLPGGPQAARAAVKWAQSHVDKDWNEWTTHKK
ncbi:hypothetical protein Leryth_021173 [Lithospermum erythrorhizon]|nr:hypothetical protein Leryth_021173 [Lithospermum erythrorhizon]